jgi:pimeloyl-ACP methyl ester carboxylesterase
MPRVAVEPGVELHVHETGPPGGPLVVLLHGFPELGFSWRHQLAPLAEAGFRLLVPDLRGFGLSDAPEPVEAYAMRRLVADVVALVDHAGREQATVIGHDWGADIAWKTAWLEPGRVRAVGGLSVPFVPRAPAAPTGLMRQYLGEDFYIVWFQEPGVAEAALERDVRRTLLAREAWTPRWADGDDDLALPAWLSEDELAVYVEAFTRTGFRAPLSLYRNIDRNWHETADAEGRRIEQPALFLTGERDPVRRFMPAEAMDGSVTDLRRSVVVPGAGHWVTQDAPEAVTEALLGFLRDVA